MPGVLRSRIKNDAAGLQGAHFVELTFEVLRSQIDRDGVHRAAIAGPIRRYGLPIQLRMPASNEPDRIARFHQDAGGLIRISVFLCTRTQYQNQGVQWGNHAGNIRTTRIRPVQLTVFQHRLWILTTKRSHFPLNASREDRTPLPQYFQVPRHGLHTVLAINGRTHDSTRKSGTLARRK